MPQDTLSTTATPSGTAGTTSALRIVLIAAVAAVGITTAIVITRPTEHTTIAAASVLTPVAITSGDLSTSERIDGTVVYSDVTTVLHRIAGQTGVTAAGSSSSTTSRSTVALAAAAQGLVATRSVAVVCDPSSTVPGTTAPTSSVPDTTAPPTTPAGPARVAPGAPPTTTPDPCATTTTTAPRPSTTVGRVGSAGTGSAGTGSTGSGSAGSGGRVTQVVTSVVAMGAAVTPGTILYSVESQPVVALTGATPAWRTMATGITDGSDVLQLETSLVALGYDPTGSMTVDGHFDSHTKAVVQSWQLGYGLPVTGKVTLGEVVFLAGPTTVSAMNVKVGDSVGDGDQILSLAGSSQQVVIAVPSGDEAAVLPGLAVKVGDVGATVTLLRSVVQNGAIVVQAVLTPAAPISGASNGSIVKVTVNITDRTNVLIVPSAALVSRLDGTYAVQLMQPDGTSEFVAVEVLAVAGLQAGIRGDGIVAGAQVLQPA